MPDPTGARLAPHIIAVVTDAWSPPNSEYPPPKPGEPALHRAARLGDHNAIRTLVAGGASIDEVFEIGLDPGGWRRPATPLMVAAGSGEGATAETVRLLLDLGADPTMALCDTTTLTFACEGLGWNYRPGGDVERYDMLAAAGCPLPSNPKAANRLLCETSERGTAGLVGRLLAAGISPQGHWDPAAARIYHERVSREMAEHRAANPTYAELPASMQPAYDQISADLERQMADQMSSAPSDFEIPLFCAAKSGDRSTVLALLRAGADPRQRDNSGRSAVFHAASAPALSALVEAGLSLEDKDQYGWTPLVEALSDGAEGLPRLRALLAQGADVHATHDRGFTVFMSAVSSMDRSVDAMQLLLDAGADPHAATELGCNACHAAIDVDGEANSEESVRATLSLLQRLGVDLNLETHAGHSPLARAIGEGTGLETRVLCELGADVNAVSAAHECDDEGCRNVRLPLIFPSINAAVDAAEKVRALLDAGCRLGVTDNKNRSPLEAATDRIAILAGYEPSSFKEKWMNDAVSIVEMLARAGGG